MTITDVLAYVPIIAYGLVMIYSEAYWFGIIILVLTQNRIMVRIVKWSEEDADKFSRVVIGVIAVIYALGKDIGRAPTPHRGHVCLAA